VEGVVNQQEFNLSVTPVRNDGYLIRVERKSVGVPLAEEFVTTWQVEEWLDQARQLMNDPLLGLLRGNLFTRTGEPPNREPTLPLPPSLVEFGQTLFDALFHGTIHQSWVTAKGIAHNRREVLHLRLGLKGDLLPRLPWEVLHEGNRPLATGADVVFSRYQSSLGSFSTGSPLYRSPGLDQNQALRILMVLAAPTDQEVLELEQEAHHLEEELRKDGSSIGEVKIEILRQPGREQLTHAIEQNRFHVLHYAGHSNLGASGGDLYLVSDRTGLTEVLSGDDLAGLLVNNGIRMAVFNSCRGVYTATANPENITESGNLTEALLKRGVPAVLAMAERIPDDVALNLSRLFYRNLKQHLPIDLSLSRARQGLLSSYGSNQLFWSLPILYLHPDFDGYLLPPLTEGTIAHQPTEMSREKESSVQVLPPPPTTVEDSEDDFLIDMLQGPLDGIDEDPEDDDRKAVLDLIHELRGEEPKPHDRNPFNQQDNTIGDEDLFNVDSTDSETAQEYIRLGQSLHQKGDLAGAISAYGQALHLDGNAAEAYRGMGISLEAYDSPAEALIAYKMAVSLDPNQEDTQQRLHRLETAHNFVSGGQTGGPSEFTTPGSSSDAAANLVTNTPPKQTMYAESLRNPTQPKQGFRIPRMAYVFLGSVVLAGLGLWGAQNFFGGGTTPDKVLPTTITQVPNNPPTTETGVLTAEASRKLNQGDLRGAQVAINQLLDQGNWRQAETAFQSVPADKLDNPTISFLRGRVAWEAVKRGDRNNSIGDARRYWEIATRGKKDDAQFFNALGFAFYAEGDLKRAGEAWLKAAGLAEERRKNKDNTAVQDELTAIAGLAIAAHKSAQTAPVNQRNELKRNAISLRNRVQRSDTTNFQPDTLAKNWLWTESAIADWRALVGTK
jgi:tetratricopeptide (TPR) repeat protein